MAKPRKLRMHLSPAHSLVQMETEAGAGALVLPTEPGVTVQGWDLSVTMGSAGTQQPCILNVAPTPKKASSDFFQRGVESKHTRLQLM